MTGATGGSLIGNAWRVWADYWADRGDRIPPLHHVRDGAGDDAFFVVDLPADELSAVLKHVDRGGEFRFVIRGTWMLPPDSWFGHWAVFSVSRRTFNSEGFGV